VCWVTLDDGESINGRGLQKLCVPLESDLTHSSVILVLLSLNMYESLFMSGRLLNYT
jgi:hypothetical protein